VPPSHFRIARPAACWPHHQKRPESSCETFANRCAFRGSSNRGLGQPAVDASSRLNTRTGFVFCWNSRNPPKTAGRITRQAANTRAIATILPVGTQLTVIRNSGIINPAQDWPGNRDQWGAVAGPTNTPTQSEIKVVRSGSRDSPRSTFKRASGTCPAHNRNGIGGGANRVGSATALALVCTA